MNLLSKTAPLIVIFFLPSIGFSETRAENFIRQYDQVIKKNRLLLPHKPVYFLPISYNENPNEAPFQELRKRPEFSERGTFVKPLESEFQVSFKVLTNRNIFDSDFDTFIGYTNRSWWQVYNDSWSRPFRETDHTPEIFARKVFSGPKKYYFVEWVGYDFGFVHESNGQIQEISRSWNRLFLRLHAFIGNVMLEVTPWYRLPDNPDENPDIEDFKGNLSILASHSSSLGTFSLELLPGRKRQGLAFSHSYHWKEGLDFFIKIDYGYGHSLLDYSNESRRIGFGIKLSNPFSHSEEEL